MLAITAALTVAAPLTVSAGELEEAEQQVERLESDLGDTTEAYERAWAEIERLRTELEELTRRAADLEEEARELDTRLGERARTVFMHGSTAELQTLFTADGPETAVQRAGMVSAIQRRETASLEEAVAVRRSLDQTEQLLEDRSDRLAALEQRLEQEAQQLQTQLASAQATADDIRTREARRRTVERGTQQGTYACIFDPGTFRFRDSWGEPRSGGRSHRGTDVFARMDEPVYAFTDGVIQRHSSSPLGGIGLYLRGTDNNVYYYAHLNSIADTGAVGRRVQAGEHIAYNGATGNASPSAPHVHFEVHPGGGSAINPYPWLAAACH
jgi:peptidoglycan LD-endopeptidase LytH